MANLKYKHLIFKLMYFAILFFTHLQKPNILGKQLDFYMNLLGSHKNIQNDKPFSWTCTLSITSDYYHLVTV